MIHPWDDVSFQPTKEEGFVPKIIASIPCRVHPRYKFQVANPKNQTIVLDIEIRRGFTSEEISYHVHSYWGFEYS